MANKILENLDIELFISEVRNYPEIWNVATEDYHDRNKKRNAWINICRVFTTEFEEKNDTEKNEICNSLLKKWKNIKDTYVRSLKKKSKSGEGASFTRKYIYGRQLSFLQQAGATTETESSFANEIADDEEQERVETGECETVSGTQSAPRYENTKRKRKGDIEASLIEFMKATPPPIPEANPDKEFFNSLLPYVNTFNADEKLEFRSEVLALTKRMRSTQQPRHQHNVHYLDSRASTSYKLAFTELQTRPHSAPEYQARASPTFQPISPHTSTSTHTSEEDYLNIFTGQ